jgi:hypothetical protein
VPSVRAFSRGPDRQLDRLFGTIELDDSAGKGLENIGFTT